MKYLPAFKTSIRTRRNILLIFTVEFGKLFYFLLNCDILIYRLDSLLYFRSNGELRLSDYYWLTTYNESNNDQYPQCKWAEEDGRHFSEIDEIDD